MQSQTQSIVRLAASPLVETLATPVVSQMRSSNRVSIAERLFRPSELVPSLRKPHPALLRGLLIDSRQVQLGVPHARSSVVSSEWKPQIFPQLPRSISMVTPLVATVSN